jgi:hypothetical protein
MCWAQTSERKFVRCEASVQRSLVISLKTKPGAWKANIGLGAIRPNQALEPTTTAVTIPAAQEVAPAVVVAHL